MLEGFEFHRVEENEIDAINDAVIWLKFDKDQNTQVRIHLPSDTRWSDDMTLDEAQRTVAGLGSKRQPITRFQVSDPNGLWPEHWPVLTDRDR